MLYGIVWRRIKVETTSCVYGEVQTERDKFDKKIYSVATVKENISIIERERRWDILLFKEALHIKVKNPIHNEGLKASKKLKLF